MKKKYYLIGGIIAIIILGIFMIFNYKNSNETSVNEETNLNLSYIENELENVFLNCTHYRDYTGSYLHYDCKDNLYTLEFLPYPFSDKGYKDGCCLKMGNSDFEKYVMYKGYSLCIKAKNIIVEVNGYDYGFYLILRNNVSEESLKDKAVLVASTLKVNDSGFNVYPTCQPGI